MLHRVVGVAECEEEEPRAVKLVHHILQPLQHVRHRLCHHALNAQNEQGSALQFWKKREIELPGPFAGENYLLC